MNSALRASLETRYRALLAYTGLICTFASLFLACPVLVLPFYPDELGLWWRLLLPAALLGAPGWYAWTRLRPEKAPTITPSEGAAVVLLAWIAALAMGTLELLLLTELSFTQAMFESTSAWTTTGLSVVDVTRASHAVLLLRSALELAGGAGLAILMVSLMGGPIGVGLPAAEGRSEQLVPHVVESTRLVVRIYAAYAIAGTVLLRLAGMDWFDAVNHAFAAVSTGGFSTRVDSIGYWDSPLVEAVTIALMFVGTTNFIVAWALMRGRFRDASRSGELRLMAVLIPLCILLLSTSGLAATYGNASKMARVAVFETITALSTTGFSTVGYTDWPDVGWVVLIALMLIGGGAGSTAGGMKQARIYLLWRAMVWEVGRALRPRAAVNVPLIQSAGQPYLLRDGDVRGVAVFLFAYLLAYLFGVLVMTGSGFPLRESLFEMASTLGTVGLSVGITSADAPPQVLWVQIFGMLLGRLEFFAVFVALYRLGRDAMWALPRPLIPARTR